MKGRFSIRRLLLRWRIALGGMAWWRFTALIFAATFTISLMAAVLYRLVTGTYVAAAELQRAGWLVAVLVAPLAQTLIAQGVVIWLVRKALPGSYLWPVLFSAVVFGGGHQSSPIYLACMLLIGAVLAFAYLSRLEKRGFAQAFLLVFFAHALNNAILFLL